MLKQKCNGLLLYRAYPIVFETKIQTHNTPLIIVIPFTETKWVTKVIQRNTSSVLHQIPGLVSCCPRW